MEIHEPKSSVPAHYSFISVSISGRVSQILPFFPWAPPSWLRSSGCPTRLQFSIFLSFSSRTRLELPFPTLSVLTGWRGGDETKQMGVRGDRQARRMRQEKGVLEAYLLLLE